MVGVQRETQNSASTTESKTAEDMLLAAPTILRIFLGRDPVRFC